MSGDADGDDAQGEAQGEAQGGGALRVASYNIRKAIGRDARRDPGRILDLVVELGADVVALQEADYRFKQRQAIFDPGMIEERTGLAPVALEGGDPGLGWHGNVVLLGPRASVASARAMELPGLEPRGAVSVDLAVGGHPVRLIAAHLGLLARWRRRQSEAILAGAALSAGRATIVMGDFNGWGREPPSLSLFHDEMREAPCGRSYPSRRPVTPLDRIYFDGPLELVGCGVLAAPLARIASDHRPIWAEMQLVGNPADA